VPAWEADPAFFRQFDRLTTAQKKAFRRAYGHMVEDLKRGQGFRSGLRIKGVRQVPGLFEMTWAPDGRATFGNRPEVRPGEAHIVWIAVGSHDILT
jgi:hypothetical protein